MDPFELKMVYMVTILFSKQGQNYSYASFPSYKYYVYIW